MDGLKLLLSILLFSAISFSCLDSAARLKSTNIATGLYDVDQMGLYFPEASPGVTKVYFWKHIQTGKKFISLNIQGYDESEYTFLGENALVYSKNSPQPQRTEAIYLTFDSEGTPIIGDYAKALKVSEKGGTKIELIGYLPLLQTNMF